jgi:hypothetical protein
VRSAFGVATSLHPHTHLFALPSQGEHLVDSSAKMVVLDKLLHRLKKNGTAILDFGIVSFTGRFFLCRRPGPDLLSGTEAGVGVITTLNLPVLCLFSHSS